MCAPSSGMEEDSVGLLQHLQEMCGSIEDTLAAVTSLVIQSASLFVKGNDVKKLALISQYNKLFEKTSVCSRKEAESVWCKNSIKNNKFEEQYEKLLDLEERFNAFLDTIDEKLKQEEVESNQYNYLQIGDEFPGDVEVYSTENKQVHFQIY